jgi:glycosyltransferase involved in cell wall biosynthesis
MAFLMDAFEGPHAGTEIQLLELIRGLDDSRFEPELIVLRPTPYVQSLQAFPCPVTILGIERLASPQAIRALLGLTMRLRRSGTRLVQILFNDAAAIGPLFCRLGGARVLVSRRDLGFWYTPTILWMLRFSNRFVDAVIANSEAVRSNVNRLEKVPLSRITVVPNGHDLEKFTTPARPGLREQLGIDPDAPIVAVVANLKALKRHGDVIRALAHVHAQRPTTHLLLLGAGQEETALRTLAAELGLAGFVHFMGRVADVVSIVKHSTVCVLASETEGLSNAILEYMACARPVVCTDVGGNPELITDGKNGYLVPVGNVTALADRMERLLSNPQQAAQFGRAAREAFETRFSSQTMVAAHVSLYDRILGSSGEQPTCLKADDSGVCASSSPSGARAGELP